MKVGILTLPLHTNYGGIVQAYALYKFLENLGHEPKLITQDSVYELPFAKKPFVYGKRILKNMFSSEKIEVFHESRKKREYLEVSKHVRPFVNKHLPQYIHISSLMKDSSLLDAIVVGSDQIWRPKYYPKLDISFLGFVNDASVRKIAYAPSFGTEQWEYSVDQTQLCKGFVKDFHHVSVREDSGQTLIRENFGLEATHVLDPTMLLGRDDYIDLLEEKDLGKFNGKIITYLLDKNQEKDDLVDYVKTCLNLEAKALNVQTENLQLSVEERIAPPLESWLAGFYESDFVVTDSFHACVFSIIFNKPFIAIGNLSRGMTRFQSLLRMFSLEERLVLDLASAKSIQLFGINWSDVNSRLEALRSKSEKFLKESLSDE